MNIALPSRTDPALLQLEADYAKLNLFDQSLWKTFADGIDIARFRGEHAYLAQMWGGMTEQRYLNTYDWIVRSVGIGVDDLIRMMGEDSAFGCITFERNSTVISRDLLDSVCEIIFLMQTLELQREKPFRVLDVGAGYGRFLHRLSQVMPYINGIGVDGVPLSTYLCQFYLEYRGAYPRCGACLPTEIPSGSRFDLAVNQYSFSEMPLSAVNFWLDLCVGLNIPYFFLTPHAPDLIHPHFITSEPDGSHLDYLGAFEKHGYKLKVQRPKFPRELADSLIYSTDYLLWER